MFKESFADVDDENSKTLVITGTTTTNIDSEIKNNLDQKISSEVDSEIINLSEEEDLEDEYDELMKMETDDETDDEEMVIESSGTKRILIYFGVGILVSFVIGLLIKLLFFNKKK